MIARDRQIARQGLIDTAGTIPGAAIAGAPEVLPVATATLLLLGNLLLRRP